MYIFYIYKLRNFVKELIFINNYYDLRMLNTSITYFLNSKSKVPINSKLNLYKSFLKPICTYGVQIWGSAKKSNIKKIHIVQNKTLRLITNALFYCFKSNTPH